MEVVITRQYEIFYKQILCCINSIDEYVLEIMIIQNLLNNDMFETCMYHSSNARELSQFD